MNLYVAYIDVLNILKKHSAVTWNDDDNDLTHRINETIYLLRLLSYPFSDFYIFDNLRGYTLADIYKNKINGDMDGNVHIIVYVVLMLISWLFSDSN